jgi:hypothetical protein
MAILGIKSRGEIGARLRVIAGIATESARAWDEEERKTAWRRDPRKLSIRRLLALVALGAIGLALLRHPWYAFCDERAANHARMSASYRQPWNGSGATSPRVIAYGRVFRSPARLAVYRSAMRDYHARMQDKWQRAATLPWLALIPDGTPPP